MQLFFTVNASFVHPHHLNVNLVKSSGKYLRILVVLSIILNLALGYKYFKTKFKYNPDYTFNRKELFEHLDIDSSSIVFLGNSLTEQFELAELFNNSNMRNRGVNGEQSDGLLSRLPQILKSHPKKIFIEIGINDIGQGIDKSTLLANYAKMLTLIQQGSPNSKVYVQSLLPVYKTGPAVTNSKLSNETIRLVNTDLLDYCKAHDITYINLYDQFALNGEMNPIYCIADGLHISGDGYLLWTKLLKEYVVDR